MLFVISLLSGLTVVCLALCFGRPRLVANPDERLIRYQARTLYDLGMATQQTGLYEQATATPKHGALLRKGLEWISGLLRPKLPSSYLQQIERQLIMAGGMASLQPVQYIALRLTAACILPTFIYLLQGGKAPFMMLAAMAGIGWIGPRFWLKRKIAERQHTIQRALPNTIDLLTVSVEAGLGLDAATARVAERVAGPLGDEFRHYLRLVRMGTPRREAMRELGERSGVPDLKSFASSIIQADQLGVSMGSVLRVQSQEMRRRRKQRAEEAAMKAPIKMLFPLVFCIFPSIFIVLLGPAALSIIGAFAKMK